jgi:hypothetical protein
VRISQQSCAERADVLRHDGRNVPKVNTRGALLKASRELLHAVPPKHIVSALT